jgi:hypothetical protein
MVTFVLQLANHQFVAARPIAWQKLKIPAFLRWALTLALRRCLAVHRWALALTRHCLNKG